MTVPTPPRHVCVIGTGMIGTSVGLALRRAGVRVGLADRDGAAMAAAIRRGAGAALHPDDPPAEVVVIATPPSAVAPVLRDAQRRGLGLAYTDVASTKTRILAEAEAAGCDLAAFVPGHPMAGRELSGPDAAEADLFTGRPWVLTPHPATRPEAVSVVAGLVGLCGARHTMLRAEVHDRAVAAISHAPHLVSSAIAARFARADQTTLSLAGRGLRDVTRIAAGEPVLWTDILEHNAPAVATELESVARDLIEAAATLRTLHATAGSGTAASSGRLTDLLVRGVLGRRFIMAAAAATDRDPALNPVG